MRIAEKKSKLLKNKTEIQRLLEADSYLVEYSS